MLAEQSLLVIEQIEHRSDVTLQMEESELELKVRRPDQARIAWAKKVLGDPDGQHPHRWSKVYALRCNASCHSDWRDWNRGGAV